MKPILFFLVILGITLACERNDFNAGYIGVEDVNHLHGNGKVKLMIDVSAEATQLIVKFNDEIKTYDLSSSSVSDPYEVVFENLAEGDYIFSVSIMNADGVESDEFFQFVHVYGEEYSGDLKTRDVTSLDYVENDIVLKFGKAPSGHHYTLCTYATSDGQMVTDSLKRDEVDITLRDVDFSHSVELQSFYYPSEYSYELFSASSLTKTWKPIQKKLDPPNISEVHLQHDDPGTAYGGSIAKLFDGVQDDGNFYIPALPNSPPHTITVDLSGLREVAQLNVSPRPSLPRRMPKRYDIYGYPGNISPEELVGNADTDEGYPFEEAWKDEMIEKGWIYLGYFEPVSELTDGWGSVEVKLDPNDPVRYLRIRFGPNWEGTQFVDLSEIAVYETKYGF